MFHFNRKCLHPLEQLINSTKALKQYQYSRAVGTCKYAYTCMYRSLECLFAVYQLE